MSSFTATARSIDGALRHEIDVHGRHTITTDEPASLGGTDTAPAPHELLAATVASCVSTMIVLYAQRRDWELGDVRVDVVYDTDSAPRQVEVTVYLPENLTPDQVQRLQRVADTCPVKRVFEAGFEFDRELVLDLAPMSANAISAVNYRRSPPTAAGLAMNTASPRRSLRAIPRSSHSSPSPSGKTQAKSSGRPAHAQVGPDGHTPPAKPEPRSATNSRARRTPAGATQ